MALKADDWKLCADWLVRCTIIAPDHPVNQPTAQVFELAQILRDGVLLCHLLNRLSPGVIDVKEFSQRPQMSQFLCLKNIRIFLAKCMSNFRIRQQDLFEPIDLFEVKDFGKVINVLSKLSKTPEAQRANIPGFNSSKKDYMNLADFANEQDPSEELYDCVRNEYEKEDEIYEDLMSIRKRQSVQPQVSRPPTRRDHCISELVETERNYVDVLNMLLQHFVRPLESILQPADHKAIFANIEQLHRIHTSFHSELSKACTGSGGSKQSDIPDCFIKWKESFLIYGDYCSNLPAAQDKVDIISNKSPELQQQIMDCQMRANEGRFRLRDLLSVPMQRVLKYHLLLKELIKNTDKEARDRCALQRALEEMQDLSLYVNEVKRDNEALQLILDIQNSIVDLQMPENTSLKDYGRLLKDGELKIKKHADNKTKNRYIFLFDKVMLMCRSRTMDKLLWGETYNYKDALILSQYKIDPSHKDKEKGYSFMLVDKQGAGAFTFYTKTEEMRNKWKDAIHMAHDNTAPNGARAGQHDFIMHSFEKPTICDVCRKLLRGVFYQGYKCALTGLAVHKECITKAERISGPPQPPPRTPNPSSAQSNRMSIGRPAIGKCKAKYTHQGNMGNASGDTRPLLMFNYDDVIEVLDTSNPNWWEGRLKGKEGIFPPNYVSELKPTTARQSYEQSNPRPRSSASMDAVPPPSPHTANGRVGSQYVNFQELSDFPWYVDAMERETASATLHAYRDGTFLVRKSTNPKNRGNYALSIKFGNGQNAVKHIKIEQNSKNMYFLADCKLFRSIPDLVQYYTDNSLEPSFPDLTTNLLFPFKTASSAPILGWCVANFDYAANQPNQLSLSRGDRVAIINKAGDSRGWWKGQIDGKVGYFPCAYVEEEE